MDSPVFRLEGIIKTKSETLDFEGPLALILQLLSKNKIEIRDISISHILAQYIEYLDAMAELDLDIASEFVAMASHLTYIKTKMLLSGGEEVSELEELITSLEELQRGDVYLQIKTAAETLSGLYSGEGLLLAGPPEYFAPNDEYRYVHVSEDLLQAIHKVIGKDNLRINSINPRETVYPHRIVFSIPEKIEAIVDKLKADGDIPVLRLFFDCGSRTELIATLVAVLELCRVGSVLLTGKEDDLTISYTGAGRGPEPMGPDFTSTDHTEG